MANLLQEEMPVELCPFHTLKNRPLRDWHILTGMDLREISFSSRQLDLKQQVI